jgi:uncharacterized coiled-coil protein SlyX
MNTIYKLIENAVFYVALVIIVTTDFIVGTIQSIKMFFCGLYNINTLSERIQQMAINLDALAAEVSNVQTVQASAVALLDSLTKELEKISADLATKSDTSADTAALNDLIHKLKVSTDSLAAAVANTPKPPDQQ